jgi:hypothetical protein
MRTRFASFLTLALLAGFLVVATQAFTLPVVQWLTFGVAAGSLLITLVIAADARRHISSGIIGGIGAVVSAWTIVASLVFGLTSVMWLGFAGATALLVLAVAGLIVHEVGTERVVHSIEIADSRSEQFAA